MDAGLDVQIFTCTRIHDPIHYPHGREQKWHQPEAEILRSGARARFNRMAGGPGARASAAQATGITRRRLPTASAFLGAPPMSSLATPIWQPAVAPSSALATEWP